MSQEIVDAVRVLGREKGISEEKLMLALEDALLQEVMELAGSGASDRRLSKLTTITSLVYRLEPQHDVCAINAAKGGDPMSHGSAGRSERGVRRP